MLTGTGSSKRAARVVPMTHPDDTWRSAGLVDRAV